MWSSIVKPQVLAVFADIAMAIEVDFQRYAPLVLSMLQQAGEVTITTTDEEIIEYINSLREAILEAYAGIIQVSHTQPHTAPHTSSPTLGLEN
jgi:importin subunit beta-1